MPASLFAFSMPAWVPSSDSSERASAAALRATGGGTVNETEFDSENGATYEVEVTKANGKTVDVRLDERFGVVTVEGDGNEGGDGGENNDVASGGRSDEGSTDEGQHADADES